MVVIWLITKKPKNTSWRECTKDNSFVPEDDHYDYIEKERSNEKD